MTAEFSSTSYAPDKLLAGNADLLASKKVTIAAGQNLVRGAVLGKASIGTATAAVKAGGNSGDGAITMDATTPVLANAQLGVYAARCTTTASGGGTFTVTDPMGNVLGTVAVAATFANQIKFSIADGTPDFSLGDGFDITVAAGNGEYVLSLTAAIDGSQRPDAILQHDADASSGALEAMAYTRGDFNENALTIGSGHTVASIREGLRAKGIHLVKAVAF